MVGKDIGNNRFQYPRSDRRRCNSPPACRPAGRSGGLSVSSVGSEAMQLRPGRRCSEPSGSFSILGRIGGDATTWGALALLWPVLFQYPRSDRRRCNTISSYCGAGCRDLSVSSVGSEAMQRGTLWETADTECLFQYPRSDRRRCNSPATFVEGDNRLWLSVSSVGSEAMQPIPVPRRGRASTATFSILGRIGGDATNVCALWATAGAKLSVSSVGSEAMQQKQVLGIGSTDRSFSILGRIGGDATLLRNAILPYAGCIFQYPRSDRRRCNAVASVESRPSEFPFSILGRIGGDATHRFSAMVPPLSVDFQYPRSDRRRCNVGHPDFGRMLPCLSVSSVGSEAMQRLTF